MLWIGWEKLTNADIHRTRYKCQIINLHLPLVFFSSSTRNCASSWIWVSILLFPMPSFLRVKSEKCFISFQSSPLLKALPKEIGIEDYEVCLRDRQRNRLVTGIESQTYSWRATWPLLSTLHLLCILPSIHRNTCILTKVFRNHLKNWDTSSSTKLLCITYESFFYCLIAM